MLGSQIVATWSTSASLFDPAGSSAIVAAVKWLEGTLLGTVSTTVAVIAVASVGFMALGGRVDIRRAITVILGCFILFGASSIVAGLQGVASMGTPAPELSGPGISPLALPPRRPTGYDPYAGASLPPR